MKRNSEIYSYIGMIQDLSEVFEGSAFEAVALLRVRECYDHLIDLEMEIDNP